MLSRRDREFPSRKTEPAPFAAKAKDLQALRDAVVDAAGVSAGFWISYLFALFYFAIAAGAVTDRDLLLENPVKLPFLNVELPLKAFFFLGPLVFLVVHAYVLLHFALLADKIGAFNAELEDQIGRDNEGAAAPPIAEQYFCAIPCRPVSGTNWNHRLSAVADHRDQLGCRADRPIGPVPTPVPFLSQRVDHDVAAPRRCD